MSRPRFVQPMAARVVDRLPEGEEWIYELKFDGYRALVIKDGERVPIRSRNDKDLTAAYRSLAAAARKLHADDAVVDGRSLRSMSTAARHSRRFSIDSLIPVIPSPSTRSICCIWMG